MRLNRETLYRILMLTAAILVVLAEEVKKGIKK